MADQFGHAQHPLRRLAALLMMNSGHGNSGASWRSILGLFVTLKRVAVQWLIADPTHFRLLEAASDKATSALRVDRERLDECWV